MSYGVQTTKAADGILESLVHMTKPLQMHASRAGYREVRWVGVWKGKTVTDAGRPDPEHGLAAELLGDWRAAERDTVAATTAASVAALTLAAASAAEEAAAEAESAANAAMDAATRAKGAAEHAKKAAAAAAEAAQMASLAAMGDKARADQSVETAEHAQDDARDRFHDAEGMGFPKR